VDIKDFQRGSEVNVRGVFLAGQQAARHFIAQRSGNIINIASTAGQRGFANGTAYVSTKFADRKLKASEIAHVVYATLAMHDVGFITEASVWATNP
jgi:3-oxoacyl-[acyl-carrier protein] reductase